MNKKILITGGAGYIGSHVVNNLLKSDYKIIVLDKLNFDNKSLAKLSKNKNLTIIAKDIRDYNNIEEHFENVDTVIH